MFIINLLKLARPRTWIFIILSFTIGWLLTGSILSINFFIGLIVYILLVANVNLVNVYTDIEEDRINLPHRIKMIERVGLKKLVYSFTILYAIATLLALTLPFWFFVVYLIAFFDTVSYSLEPLRFKKRPILSLITFSGAVFFPLIGGWTLTNDIFSISALIFFLGYWFLTYGTIKNLPDFKGDKIAGLRTSATVFSTRRKAVGVASALLLSSYVILFLLLLFNYIEYKFALLFLLLPVISIICYKALKAKTYESLEKLHTYGLIYADVFLSLTLVIISPTIYSFIFLVVLLSLQSLILKTRFDSR